MGNRAVITTNKNLTETGMYLHWNGGRDSVEAFLAYCKLKGYRAPDTDDYGWAYLAGVVTNFLGSGLSCGINTAKNLDCDNWDNGVYIIKNWLIVGRKFTNKSLEQNECDLKKMIEDLDKCQPEHMRLTQEEWAKFDSVKKKVIAARKKTIYHK